MIGAGCIRVLAASRGLNRLMAPACVLRQPHVHASAHLYNDSVAQLQWIDVPITFNYYTNGR